MWSTTMVTKCHENKHSALFILLYGLFITNTAHASFNDNRYNQLGKDFPTLFFTHFKNSPNSLTSSFSSEKLFCFLFLFILTFFLSLSHSILNPSFFRVEFRFFCCFCLLDLLYYERKENL